MATVAVGERGRAVVARQTTDRRLLRTWLERDRLYAAYAICDLEEREFPRTRWGVATAGDEVIAIGLEYGGLTPQPLFLMGRNDGISAILRDVLKPRAAYIAARTESLPAVASHYRIEPGPPMIRMWTDRSRFNPVPAPVERLLPVEVNDLNRLYQLGFAAWLPANAISEGIYYGIRVNGKLVAAAGTHVISREARLAAHPRRAPWQGVRHRRHRRRDRRAAALLRPGRAQCPVRQPARHPGVSEAGLRGPRQVRGTARPPRELADRGFHRPVPPLVRRPSRGAPRGRRGPAPAPGAPGPRRAPAPLRCPGRTRL
jgi:hypothetical protein